MAFQPCKIIDGNLVVTARACYDSINIWHFNPEILFDRIIRTEFNELILVATDCEEIFMSGLIEVIRLAAKDLSLDKSKVKIITYQDPKVDWATFIQWNPLPLNGWIRNTIKREDFNINNVEFKKTFLALVNRVTLHRFRLVKFLHQSIPDHVYLSCRLGTNQLAGHFTKIDADFYRNDIDFSVNLPIMLDYTDSFENTDYATMLKSIVAYKNDYLIEIIFETNIYDSNVFTEKTMRGFYTGKPFILFAGPGALKNLRDWGFKTFSPFIDESYDAISNTEQRFQAICKEITRLSYLPRHKLVAFANDYHSIFEHNQKVFFEDLHKFRSFNSYTQYDRFVRG